MTPWLERPAISDRRVDDLMTRDPVTVLEQATLGDAADLLTGFEISALAVVDLDGILVGVLSETDLVRLRARGMAMSAWHRLPVADAMSTPALVVGMDATVGEAARLMTDLGIHRLFVVDEDRVPVGVISESDVVTEIAEADE